MKKAIPGHDESLRVFHIMWDRSESLAKKRRVPRVTIFDGLVAKWLLSHDGVDTNNLLSHLESAKRRFFHAYRPRHVSDGARQEALMQCDTEDDLAPLWGWFWERALIELELLRLTRPAAEGWLKSPPPNHMREEILEYERQLTDSALNSCFMLSWVPAVEEHISTTEMSYLKTKMRELFSEGDIQAVRDHAEALGHPECQS